MADGIQTKFSPMQYETVEYPADANILKRRPFEGIAQTLDFSSVTDTTFSGKKIVKAGTPIGKTGAVDNTATVAGILLHDVVETRPQGTLLKKAYINAKVAQAHSGVTYAEAMMAALPMVVFEDLTTTSSGAQTTPGGA